MSNLLEQASLVMIPSGYKEDVVYSEIPIDGSGDLQFTRSSNGTRVNSAGLVEDCPWNLFEYSEDFSNAAWVKSASATTITTNSTTAPNGTTTADTWTINAAGARYVGQTKTVTAGAVTASFFVKKGTSDWFYIRIDDGTNYAGYTFDVATGQLGQSVSSVLTPTASIVDFGNGWYRCIVATTVAVTSITVSGWVATSATTISGLLGASLICWGAQLNIGSTAKPYFPTTDRLNVPRLTYQNGGGGCPSLLLEKQSTNIVLNSEDFSNASWGVSQCSITANQTISPDGTQNADKLIEDAITGIHEVYSNTPFSLTSGVAYTKTIYAKSAERTQISLNFVTGGFGQGASVIADLSAGTLGTVNNVGGVTGSTATIINVGNGWYRISLTMTPVSTANFYADFSPALNGAISYAGNGTSGVFVWGAQIEASSYPTSYIPTTSSSATRVADVANKSSISSLFGASATSFFMDFEITQVSSDATWTVTGYDGSNLFSLCQFGAITNFPRIVFDGGVDTTLGTALSIGRHKIAVSFATNDFRAYIDGALVLTDTSCTYNRYDRIAVNGTAWTGNTNNNNSFKLNEYAQFPNVLTNAELASLTTI
jgi:hypothetical protein